MRCEKVDVLITELSSITKIDTAKDSEKLKKLQDELDRLEIEELKTGFIDIDMVRDIEQEKAKLKFGIDQKEKSQNRARALIKCYKSPTEENITTYLELIKDEAKLIILFNKDEVRRELVKIHSKITKIKNGTLKISMDDFNDLVKESSENDLKLEHSKEVEEAIVNKGIRKENDLVKAHCINLLKDADAQILATVDAVSLLAFLYSRYDFVKEEQLDRLTSAITDLDKIYAVDNYKEKNNKIR